MMSEEKGAFAWDSSNPNWRLWMEKGIFGSRPEPPFEDEEMLKQVWGRKWGVSDEVGILRVVLVHRPREEEFKFVTADSPYDEKVGWRYDPEGNWLWPGKDLPDVPKMQEEHDRLVEIMRNEGIEIINLEETVSPGSHVMACMSRDYAVAVKGGVIICRMAQKYRRGEESLVAKKIASLGVPILRTIHGTGVFEGGNFALLNEENAVVGRSAATNEEGARQVEEVLRVLGINLIRMDIPDHQTHIDGFLGMVGKNLALVNPYVPYSFREKLKELGIKIIPTGAGVFDVNVLVLRPGKIVASHISNKTTKTLEKHGIEVIKHDMLELEKAQGGPRCATCPLIRDPA